jgi:uncharacterized protein (TIGR02391 family)
METFCWLEAQTLIIRDPEESGNNGMRVLSKRARNIKEEKNYKDYIDARFLRKDVLHPNITSVWGTFVRGKFGSAVFEAMKEVEIAVRKASEQPADLLGVNLMRRAFHVENGPLTDLKLPPAERESLLNLFVGSIGYYKNPGSHRETKVDDPLTAIEVIMLANRLLKIVDVRKLDNTVL